MTADELDVIPCQVPPNAQPPTEDDIVNYLDPFNCECRAYGRLKQEQREDLAVPAYGYVLLTEQQDQQLNDAMGRDNNWYRDPCHAGQPVRAIVKELIEDDACNFQPTMISDMFADLETLRSLGILVRDIKADNYLEGTLVDFSCAWTMYHRFYDWLPDFFYLRARKRELINFELLIDDWNIDPDNEQIEAPEAAVRYNSGRYEDLGIDPADYPYSGRNSWLE